MPAAEIAMERWFKSEEWVSAAIVKIGKCKNKNVARRGTTMANQRQWGAFYLFAVSQYTSEH